MTTLDKHASVPVELALQLEGAALNAGLSTAELLESLLERFAKKTRRNRETEALRTEIREQVEEGATDTEIAENLGVSQQTITRHRTGMGLPINRKLKTHCKRGHPLTGDNVYIHPSQPGARDCRTCRALRESARL